VGSTKRHEVAGERRAVHPTAAERDEGLAARVVPALDRDEAPRTILPVATRMTRRRPQRSPGRAAARSRGDGWARRDDIERELAAEAREISEGDRPRVRWAPSRGGLGLSTQWDGAKP
jgi:hypothetical protein